MPLPFKYLIVNVYPEVISYSGHLAGSCWSWHLPVTIDKAGINVVGAFDSSNGLKTHSCGLVWHYVDKAVLELVAGEVGTDES